MITWSLWIVFVWWSIVVSIYIIKEGNGANTFWVMVLPMMPIVLLDYLLG